MSTARYDNAGKTGTGTTVDNMASRVKAWITVNNTAATATIYQSVNVSSLTDGGVGAHAANFTASFTGVTYCGLATASNDAANYNFVSPANPPNSLASGRSQTTAKVSSTNNGTPVDAFALYMAYLGDLA